MWEEKHSIGEQELKDVGDTVAQRMQKDQFTVIKLDEEVWVLSF